MGGCGSPQGSSRAARWAGVVGRSPVFARLLGARVASLLGDATATVTLIIYLAATDGRGVAVGMLLVAGAAPQALSPLAGTLADRVDQRRLMIASESGQVVLMLVVALLLPSLTLLLVLWFIRGLFEVLFHPAGRSSIPRLVDERDLAAANGLLGAGGHSSRTIGPAVAGLLFPVLGAAGVLLLVASLSLVALALLVSLPRLYAGGAVTDRGTFTSELREGVVALRRVPVAGVTAVVLFSAVLFASLDDVALAFLATEEFGATEAQVGLLFSAAALGLVVGGLFVAAIGKRSAPTALLVAGLGLTGIGLLGVSVAPLLGLALLAQLLNGFGNGLEVAGIDTLIHREVPQRLHGRTFGTIYGAAFLASAIGYGAGGVLLDVTSPRIVFAIAGTGVIAIALAASAALARAIAHPLE